MIKKLILYFKRVPKKDKLVYDAMIACYAQNGKPENALMQFSEMLKSNSNIQPDEITLSIVVSASSQLGDTSFGTWIESYIAEHRIQMDDLLRTSLIDLYMKGGDFDKAFKLFGGLNKKDKVSYSAMIMGCGINGMATEASSLFREMIEEKIPYGIMVDMLGRGGRLEEAYKLIISMPMKPNAGVWGALLLASGLHNNVEFEFGREETA